MQFIRLAVIASGIACLLAGCVSPKTMALMPTKPAPVLTNGNGIVLLVLEAARQSNVTYPLELAGQSQLLIGACTLEDSANKALQAYQIAYRVVAMKGNSTLHLLSFELPAGDYILREFKGNLWLIRDINAVVNGPTCVTSALGGLGTSLLISAIKRNPEASILVDYNRPVFSFTTNLKVTCVPSKVAYAGHLTVNMAPKGQSGPATSLGGLLNKPVLPYFDKAVYSDKYAEDMELFFQLFPFLKTSTVEKACLGPL